MASSSLKFWQETLDKYQVAYQAAVDGTEVSAVDQSLKLMSATELLSNIWKIERRIQALKHPKTRLARGVVVS